MINLRDLSLPELLEEIKKLEEKPYRAEQVYSWVFQKSAVEIDSMTDISKAFREVLKAGFYIGADKVCDVRQSSDGTRKFLSELEDGSRIESVIIPEEDRLTLCVSTQAGCALGCRFCLTGSSGFIRNLKLCEMANQVFSANSILKEGERLTNIVLMGMGEPLANYDNVMRFLGVLTDGKGFHFSHNKITVSTAGLVPAIKKFGADSNVNLAVSLNATTDEVRDRIMPINRKYPLEELLGTLREFPLGARRYITIEYVMLGGVNDTSDDARRLVRLLRGIKCKINLIPFNPFPGSPFKAPDERGVILFHKIVKDSGYFVITRASKGADILAACGQLRGAYEG